MNRRRALQILFTVFLTVFTGGATVFAQLPFMYSEAYLDSMAITLPPGSERPYLFSGTGTSFFYGSTQKLAEDGWMGLHWGSHKLFDDFIVTVDGQPLDRSEATVIVKPHEVLFQWSNGIELVISPLGRDRDDLMVNMNGAAPHSQLGFFLVFPSGSHVLPIKDKNHVLTQFYVISTGSDTTGILLASNDKYRPVQMQPTRESNLLAGHPIFGGVLDDTQQLDMIVIFGGSLRELSSRIQEIIQSDPGPIEQRKQWLLDQLNSSPFHCDDPRITKAVNWAKISLGMLSAEDDSLIWAGLPWFSEGWARDTFISLPGAALVLGKYDMAERILRRFARWQNTDPGDPSYGRVPNRARPNEIIYNTTDGTPWFVRELYEYGLYSGDRELWKEMMATGGVVERSIEGARKYHTDKTGLLTHGDAETWMDAVGPEGPWSPRGNRAVDVQALWLAQLEAAIRMADAVGGPDPKLVQQWRDLAAKIRAEIPELYLRPDGLGLYDHLNADNTPDRKIRPNQLFALTVPLSPVFTPDQQKSIFKTVHDSLVYEWGVASLAQTDEDFHPYHQTPEYPKDAAYHMGIVWTWLSGAYKSASHQGWSVTDNELGQILDRGAAGTLSENLDAVPRNGAEWPRTSGTISQAWSLAELLRSWYQDNVGLKPALDDPGTWLFNPRVPEAWGAFETTLFPNGLPLRISYTPGDTKATFRLELLDDGDDSTAAPSSLTLRLFPAAPGEAPDWKPQTMVLSRSAPTSALVLPHVNATDVLASGQDGTARTVHLILTGAEDQPMLTPHVDKNLKALRPPDYPLLDGHLAVSKPNDLKVIFDAEDSTGDDDGGAGYGYPTRTEFLPGILDLRHFRVLSDGVLVRFELTFSALSQPGWHPEYGFQLTFATVAIRTDIKGRKRSQLVERNSGWKLAKKDAADRMIHVGGGFEIVDADRKILAAYHPSERGFELGDVSTSTVAFTVPLDLIGGDPSKWRITVLAGAQDDHGGAGVGEFRTVSEQGGPWEGSGGGPGKPNVYDVLQVSK
ncbi:MAG: amylo-alpha-1,6-glucosidase [bacterium]